MKEVFENIVENRYKSGLHLKNMQIIELTMNN